jgi:hypothetical protein
LAGFAHFGGRQFSIVQSLYILLPYVAPPIPAIGRNLFHLLIPQILNLLVLDPVLAAPVDSFSVKLIAVWAWQVWPWLV